MTWFCNSGIIDSFLDKEIAKKKFLPAGGSWFLFISPGWWIGNEQLFKIGLAEQCCNMLLGIRAVFFIWCMWLHVHTHQHIPCWFNACKKYHGSFLLMTLVVWDQCCNLTLVLWFWATKVCLWVRKISKICLLGHLTGRATSWKANFENYSRYYLIKYYQFLSI